LEKVVQREGIEPIFRHNLTELRPDAKEAVFENIDTHEHVTVAYDMVHVPTPMAPPDAIRESALVNEGGWVDVDKQKLRSGTFPEVFAIGDSQTGTGTRGASPRCHAWHHGDCLLQRLLVMSCRDRLRHDDAR
jgi:sulfide:quinone oxidoreductase